MKILVSGNNKGGVGKTFVSSLIAEYMSKIFNKKVLLIDYDPQCNLSQRYLDMEMDAHNQESFIPPIHPDFEQDDPTGTDRASIADIFQDNTPFIWPYPTFIKNLDIIPASGKKLIDSEKVSQSEVLEKVYNKLENVLLNKSINDNYDIVIIDTGPSKGPLTISAIRVATHFLIPTKAEDKSIKGVLSMYSVWFQETLRSNRKWPLKIAGILANQIDHRTALHNNLFDELINHKDIGKYVIPNKISQRIAYAENDQKGSSPRSIFDLRDKDPAKIECLDACEFITKRIFENG